MYACRIEGQWHTVGDLLSYLKTTVAFSLQHPAIGASFRHYLTELDLSPSGDPRRRGGSSAGT